MKRIYLSMTMLSFCYLLTACGGGGGGGNDSATNSIYTLTQNKITAEDLDGEDTPGLVQLSNLSRPEDTNDANIDFSGTLTFSETEMITLITDFGRLGRGRKLFPRFSIELVSNNSDIIPIEKNIISTRQQGDSFWDVVVGSGKKWNQIDDQGWQWASLPINLVSRMVGQVRNCIAIFRYNQTEVSKSYVQCSQETSPIDHYQPGDMRALIDIQYSIEEFPNRELVVDDYQQILAKELPVHDWSAIDENGSIKEIFNRNINMESEQSLAALVIDEEIYFQPPQTRHGAYPYVREMRHGVYSVTKSLVGSLTLLYFSERYGDKIFDALIADYVPGLAGQPGWQNVTFEHAINMVSGTNSNYPHDVSAAISSDFWSAESANETIDAITRFGDAAPLPGETFNYSDANFFALSYALQKYVEQQEGVGVYYWDLVKENVLKPIGIDNFAVQVSHEIDGSPEILTFSVGAYPTLDETAKIALLFSNNGEHKGQQILHRKRTQEALNRTDWSGYDTNKGGRYLHSFWLDTYFTGECDIQVPYMSGHGANYVAILPSGIIIIRFMDQNNYDLGPMIQAAEKIRSSCP